MKNSIPILIIAVLFGLLASCENKPNQDEQVAIENDSIYLAKGQQIAAATFSVLSGKLQAAMKEGGVPNAVQYCNLAAFPLVDSLSELHKATIRRVSSLARNPKDAPMPTESPVLEQYESAAKTGGDLQPKVVHLDGNAVAFFSPIRVNTLCLQCHGKVGEHLSEEDYALIKELYPNDRAIGYGDGDFRGMWSIVFKK